MNSCSFRVNIENNKALTALKTALGTNSIVLSGVLTNCIKGMTEDGIYLPTDDFKSFWGVLHKDTPLDFNTSDTNMVVDAMLDYYDMIPDSVDKTAYRGTTNENVVTFGYQSATARKEAIDHCIGTIISESSLYQNDAKSKEKTDSKKEENTKTDPAQWAFYVYKTRQHLTKLIRNRLSIRLGRDMKDEFNKARKDKTINIYKWVEEQFGDKATSQDLNLLALFKEAFLNKDFFDEIRRDSRLGTIRATTAYSELDQLDENISDESDDFDDDSDASSSTEEVDGIMKAHAAKDGQPSDISKQISKNIRDYLYSLPKLSNTEGGPNEYHYDLNNTLGVRSYMDGRHVLNIILGRADFYNVSTMISSIEQLSNEIPGFACLKKLVYDLNNNADFRMSFYKDCAKKLITKVEVSINDGETTVSDNSGRVQRRSKFLFDCLNDTRHAILNIDIMQLIRHVDVLKANNDTLLGVLRTKNDKLIEKYKNKVIKELHIILSSINRDITEAAISHYLTTHQPVKTYQSDSYKWQANASTLIDILTGKSKTSGTSTLVSIVEQSQTNYKNIRLTIAENKEYNKKLANDGKQHETSEFKPVDELRGKDYVDTRINNMIQNLVNELMNHVVIDVELTGRNVKGKNVSNVVDATMMTRIIDQLSTTENVETYGKIKFKSRMYDFSNILIEQKDDKGNVINKGIFRIVDGKKVPTEYATKLIQIKLFDGIREEYSDKALQYKEMSYGDFVNVAFDMYSQEKDFATYFMRIPSDAPKIFTVRAPRYQVGKMMRLLNEGSLNAAVDRDINNIEIEVASKSIRDTQYISSTGEVIKHLLGQAKRVPVGGTIGVGPATVTFTHKINGINIYYKLDGTVINRDGVKYITNITNVRYLDISGNDKAKLNRNIEDAIRKHLADKYKLEGWVDSKGNSRTLNYEIDTKHIVFQQLKNSFKQELHRMAIAINAMFETDDDGRIIHKDGKPVFKSGWKTREERLRKGYKNYHYNGDDVIVNGKLTGNVFRSNRFNIFFEASETNPEPINVNYMDDVINMIDFFSNAENGNHLRFKKEVNPETGDSEVVSVDTSRLDAAIDDKIKSWITDYCENTRQRLAVEYNGNSEKFAIDKINEFAINTHLMYINFDDLFEGDSKFYGDGQTLLKRAKETQMGGVRYGNTNFVGELESTAQDVPSVLDTITFTHKTATGDTAVNLRLTDRFKAVTIKNTKREDKQVLDNLVKELVANGTSPEVAKKIIFGPKGTTGFQGTKVNDAQSYITFEEWIRRIVAKGQYTKYRALIDAIYDETKPVPVDLIKEFVQVQKNVYYDLYYDKDTGIEVSRQIKNAEFVLIPRFIRGTDLERVYNTMKEAGVAQLNTSETSKAAKHQEITLFDVNTGELRQDALDSFKNIAETGAAETYFYSNLYTQLETPQHLNSSNKAAIQFMKKILDNIDHLPDIDGKPHPLKTKKKEIMDDYIANIMESYDNLLNELSVPRNPDGSIKIENGVIPGLNAKVFLDKLRDELMRLGLDSNSIDYVTQVDEDSTSMDTIMPNFFGNFGKKLQNIAQAVFNNSITRQKLPGFHAVQVTQVGFGNSDPKAKRYVNKTDVSDELTRDEYNALSDEDKKKYRNKFVRTSDKLRYHPNGERHIEIMLPKSAFGFNRNDPKWAGKSEEQINREFLEELKAQGLDTMIGYRIPTEGKQSMCVMKVVDFVDDSYGSTIVVPDEWVAQTGSDFDVDSVYGFQFAYNKDNNGGLHKTRYITSDDFNKQGKYAWFNYIAKHIGGKINGITHEEYITIKETVKKETKDEFNDARKKLQELETEAYENLPNAAKDAVKQVHKMMHNSYGDTLNKEQYDIQLNTEITAMQDIINNYKNPEYPNLNDLSDEDIQNIKDYIGALWASKGDLNNDDNLYDTISARMKEQIDAINNGRDNAYKRIAETEGLMSQEEFLDDAKENPSKYNSNKARTNHILQNMIDILSSDEMLEENLGRSNFEDVMAALNAVASDNFKKERSNRSPYDFLNQARYQEDAMSGAKLKAFSVTRDTFCSVCNTVRPTLGRVKIRVTYPKSMFSEDELDKLAKRYEEYDIADDKVTVNHAMFGWSKDNKNIVDRILTSYSSETTAHILDAIKEGAIPNVNDYTFGVYKTLLDIGCDYETAVAFIMNPVVTRIVRKYNASKSIYNNDFVRPIDDIKRELVDESGLIDAELLSIDEINKAIERLAAYEDTNQVALNKEQLIKWAKQPNSMTDEDALQMIRRFEILYNLSQEITAITRCCNPDKFGAKQTLYATRKIFDDIDYILKEQKTPTLSVDGKHILKAIYPFVDAGCVGYHTTDDNQYSAYRILDAFLRYSSAASVLINSQLLTTQSERFVSLIKDIGMYLSNKRVLSEKTYNRFEQYVLGSKYLKAKVIRSRIYFDINDGLKLEDVSPEDADKAMFVELQRIQGLNRSSIPTVLDAEGNEIEFSVDKISDPTQDEINQFAQLSPAQKVEWIKNNVTDAGLFSNIRTRLTLVNTNIKKNNNLQRMSYSLDNIDIEVALEAFDKAFNNGNPLFVLAAIDLIKYAFVVEGYKVSRGGITKIIKNSALTQGFGYRPDNNNGTGIVDDCLDGINDLDLVESDYENFIRANSDISELPKASVKRIKKDVYELARGKFGLVCVEPTAKNMSTLRKYGIIEETDENHSDYSVTENGHTKYYKHNKYVKLSFGKDTYVHKIVLKTNGGKINKIYLYPLNPLMSNENSVFSVNPENNVYPNPDYYDKLIEFLNARDLSFTVSSVTSAITTIKKEGTNYKDYMATPVKGNTNLISIDSNDNAYEGVGALNDILRTNFGGENDGYTGQVYFRNLPLSYKIKGKGLNSSIVYSLKVPNAQGEMEDRKFTITRLDSRKVNEKYVSGNPKKKRHTSDARAENIDNLPITLEDIIKSARDSNTNISNLFVAEPYTEAEVTDFAVITDVIDNEIEYVNKHSTKNSLEDDVRTSLASTGIIRGVSLSKENERQAMSTIAEFIDKKVDSFIADITGLLTVDGILRKATDEEFINSIKNSKDKVNEIVSFINKVDDFLKKHAIYNTFNIENEDSESQYYLSRIQAKLDKLAKKTEVIEFKDAVITHSIEAYSTDPRIKSGLINILTGLYETSFGASMFHDIQDTNNPFVQTLISMVQNEVSAVELIVPRLVKEFQTTFDAIVAEAKAAGKPINFDNIFDEYGRFTRLYNNEFKTEVRERIQLLKDAEKKYAENSTVENMGKLIRTKQAWLKWKHKHVEQKLVDEFYDEQLAIEDEVIEKAGNDYFKYEMLRRERDEIHKSKERNEPFTPEQETRLAEIRQQLYNLTSDSWYDYKEGGFEPKTKEEKERAQAIVDYQKKNKELYDKYYIKQNIYGFEELRDKYLTIVRTKENRDPITGMPRVPMSSLVNDVQYNDAKQWLASHTREKPSDTVLAKLEKAFKALTGDKKPDSILHKLAGANDAYDENGTIDGRKLNDKQRASIKANQEVSYGTSVKRVNSDEPIINNAKGSTEVYSDEFYKKISGGGIKAKTWKELVAKYNAIVRPYWSAEMQCVQTWLMDTDTLTKLREVIQQFNETRPTVKGSGGLNAKRAYAFRHVNAVTEINDSGEIPSGYNYQLDRAKVAKGTKGDAWFDLWLEVNNEIDVDKDGNEIEVPSTFMYGRIAPKNKEKWLDKTKTEALETVSLYTAKVDTKYWDKVLDEKIRERNRKINEAGDDKIKIAEAKAEYEKWYEDNTVYNPHTRAVEPIACWRETVYLDAAQIEHQAIWQEQRSVPKQEYLNTKADPEGGIYGNYKPVNPEYNNSKELTEYEIKMRDYLEKITAQMVKTEDGKAYIKEGFAPARMGSQEKSLKWYAKEAGKFVGINAQYNEDEKWPTTVDYDDYTEPSMKMLAMLKKPGTKVPKKPWRKDFAESSEYDQAMIEYLDAMEQYRKNHGELIDRDWRSVYSDFIKEAARYNAMQDCKDMLFFGRKVVNDIKINVRSNGFYGGFVPTAYDREGNPLSFETMSDKNLIEQYDTFIRRFLYNQWKKSQGVANRIASGVQGITSAKYMMLNLRGGIANVTYGESQIISEAFAREYVNKKQYLKGKAEWFRSVADYLGSLNSETNKTLNGALIRFFNVLDYDEINGVPRVLNQEEALRRLRNYAFAQQSAGEHFMQNAMLLSMLYSHRLVKIGEENGVPKYRIMNTYTYTRHLEEETLKGMLSEQQKSKFEAFVKEIRKNDETKKDYVYLKRDLVFDFCKQFLTPEEQNKYIKLRNEAVKNAEKEFEDDKVNPTLHSQFELVDGSVAFKAGSILSQLDNTNLEDFGNIKPGDAMQLLGRFRMKTIGVNKRIHGVYDKLGAARFEEVNFMGSLCMQYHKHLPVGINKRWKRRGSYNENRETLEKGTYQSIIDFLSIPIRDLELRRRLDKNKNANLRSDARNPEFTTGMTEKEEEVIGALQTLIKAYLTPIFTTNVASAIYRNYNLLPAIDRANIRRVAVGLGSLTAAMATLIALKCLSTKDKKYKKLIGLGIYESDRLASELFMYTPTGILSEAKTLYSSPIAGENIFEDALKSLNEVCKMILDGEDYNPYYTTGRYAGRHKIGVYFLRNIPIYRQWESLMEIDKANDFYKVGSNNNFVPVDKIAKKFSK